VVWQWTPVLYGGVAGKNKFRFFLVVWGKFVVEEEVTQGESVVVPIKRVEGSKSAFPDSGISHGGCVGAMIVFLFSEIIPHRAKILSCRYSVISMVACNVGQKFVLLFFRL